MAQMCRHCSRPNPPEAAFCYHDGQPLVSAVGSTARLHTSLQPFANPFVFPSGRRCLNFDQLIRECLEDWPAALALLGQGQMERFFTNLGRRDLASAARTAARCPSPSLALDELLARIPSSLLQEARLQVDPLTLNLDPLRVGEDRHVKLLLSNRGSRLLHGTITSDCLWLGLGAEGRASEQVFQFLKTQTIPVLIRGQHLRANLRSLEGRLVVSSNGGGHTIVVRAPVTVQPFPTGVLAGARSPRQLVEKTQLHPREAVALFESGAVAEWFQINGWTYPVQGPRATGTDAVRQLFRALGLIPNLPSSPPAPMPPPLPSPPVAVQVVPFEEGVLAGARTPAELAQKARAAPHESAALFERGRVAAWYRKNGWNYPVQGPFASGVDAVLQFLSASGHTLPEQAALSPPPIVPFEEGPLAGARTPTELVEKTRAAPLAASPLFESGKVAHWYRRNGWIYPVEGPGASGFDAVLQFLNALGLSLPLPPSTPGETLHARVQVTVSESAILALPVTPVGDERRPGAAQRADSGGPL